MWSGKSSTSLAKFRSLDWADSSTCCLANLEGLYYYAGEVMGCTISEGARWELCLSGEAADARVGSGSGRRSFIEGSPSSLLSMLRGPSAGNDQKKMVVLHYGAPQPACFPEIALRFRPERCRGRAGHMQGEGDAPCEYGRPTRTHGFNDSVKFSLTCFLCAVIAVRLCMYVCGWVAE